MNARIDRRVCHSGSRHASARGDPAHARAPGLARGSQWTILSRTMQRGRLLDGWNERALDEALAARALNTHPRQLYRVVDRLGLELAKYRR